MTALWRVFPWDPDADPGDPFSPSYVPPCTGRGRFDLPLELSRVLYLAELPEHAVAEGLQPWRNRTLRPGHLRRADRPLALVRVRVSGQGPSDTVDLCDPHRLVELDIPPDRVAAGDRRTTQPLARRAWDAGHTGLRWWSVFRGEWHGAVLFVRRLRGRLEYGEPERLTLETDAVRAAAATLGMRS